MLSSNIDTSSVPPGEMGWDDTALHHICSLMPPLVNLYKYEHNATLSFVGGEKSISPNFSLT